MACNRKGNRRTKTSDTTETVHTHTSGHEHGGVVGSGLPGRSRERRGGEAGGRAKAESGHDGELHFSDSFMKIVCGYVVGRTIPKWRVE
jgi:hypothetical protein